jgi:hypothetical protein
MRRRKIIASVDDHDFDQLILLAKMNKVGTQELVRRVIREHLDSSKPHLKEALSTKGQDNA